MSVSKLKADTLYLNCLGLMRTVLGVGYLLLYSKIINIIHNFVRHKNWIDTCDVRIQLYWVYKFYIAICCIRIYLGIIICVYIFNIKTLFRGSRFGPGSDLLDGYQGSISGYGSGQGSDLGSDLSSERDKNWFQRQGFQNAEHGASSILSQVTFNLNKVRTFLYCESWN